MPKILLVEDNEANREMLSYRLKRREYELLIAVDGAEAVSTAVAEKPDLILMDLSLPILNGWEATKRIKANPDTQTIPVIALTARAMSGDRQKALEAGCDDYDTKPIDFPRLIDKIKVLLKRSSRSKTKKLASKNDSIKANPQSPSVAESSTLESKATESIAVEAVATKILLVEDDEANREMLSYRLKRREYELLIAVDGAEAVSIAVAEKPDLIVMDLSLPILNGWEATKRIKANPDTQTIPVIALTAHAMSGDRQKALEAGCDDYDTKPIDFPRLIDKIKVLLKRSSRSKTKKLASKNDSIEASPQLKSISEEYSQQKPCELLKLKVVEPLEALSQDPNACRQQHLNLSQEETELLPLQQVIKIVYSPIGKRNWRTGLLVKLSKSKAKINSKRTYLISPNTKIEIRCFISGNLKLGESMYAEILEVSKQNKGFFLVRFSSQYNQILELLRTIV